MSYTLSRVTRLGMCLWIAASLAATPTFADPPKADPCGLLTTAEVEQSVGSLKNKPTGDREGDAAWCSYEFANGKDLMEVWVFPADAINRGRKVSKKKILSP